MKPDRAGAPAGSRAAATLLRIVLAFVLSVVGVLLVVPAAPARAAAGDLTLAKSAGTVLVGGTATFTITATNHTASTQYNLSFSDVLPVGASYMAGSTSPSSYGDPAVTTVQDGPGITHQVLVWSNLVDIAAGASLPLTYKLKVPQASFPLGTTVPNSATAAVNSDPYVVPDFAADGTVKPGTASATGTASAAPTVSAIQLTKSTGNISENELLRGVGDHQGVFRLTVTNNDSTDVHNTTVVDYIPAGLEFLGCGNRDISPAEYPGANTDVHAVSGCVQPSTVETVLNPSGYPAGVYTKLTWALGTLAAGAVQQLPYAVGVPMRANTLDFGGTTPAITGAQTANLDNNNGASTRETTGELSLTNRAVVSANFGGDAGVPVSDTASSTVTAEDLKVVKSANTGSFVQGDIVTYTLTIDTSEYVETAGLTVSDVLPAGLCPRGASSGGTFEDCDPTSGNAPSSPNATFTATPDANGAYTLTFTPSRVSLAHNDQLVIAYNALARTSYASSSPTSALDTFTNSAGIAGTTTPRSGINSPETGSQAVADTSSWTLTAASPSVSKLRQQNVTATSPQASCPLQTSQYTKTPAADETPYRLGDLVCFLVKVHFSDAADTRFAALTDFLPSNLTYAPALGGVVTGPGLVTSTSTSSSGRTITWTFLDRVARSTDFVVVVAARVTSAVVGNEADGTVEKPNLAKFRFSNTAGQSQALRDSIDVPFAPAAPIGLDKSVQAVNGDSGNTGPRVDGNDTVKFGVKLSNLSTDATDYSAMSGIVVWDVLPTGMTCADVVGGTISDGGTCDAVNNRIVWTVGTAAAPLAHGSDQTLTYQVAVPSSVGVSTTFTNHAGVVSYQTPTNLTGAFSTHHPANNIDPSTDSTLIDVPAADDTATVNTADAKVAKSNVTDITETGNTAAQAVVGETLTYTIGVTVPARTSVFNGKLVDPLPAGIVIAGPATAAFSATGTSPAGSALPSGVSLDTAGGTLTFGGTYANNTDTDQLFEVKLPARIGTDATNIDRTGPTNTATFTSDTAATGGTAITPRTASSSVTVVAPAPALAKTSSLTQVSGGSVVTYTLTATNPNRADTTVRPPMHDSWVVDCLPGALTFGSFTQTPAGTTASFTAGTGSNGCLSGYTRIAWNIADLAGGASLALKYTATVTSVPSGGDSYTNTATLTGSTLKDNKADPLAPDNPNERTFTASSSRTLTVTGASINKTANPTSLAPGQTGSFTVTVTIPSNIAFYDSAVMDALPAQMAFEGTTSVSCVNTDNSDCGSGIPWTLLGPTSSVVGWVISDLAPSAQVRTITIVYTATMNVAGNLAGNARQNTANYRWNVTNGTDPTSPNTSWGTKGVNKAASVTVIEPSMSITKTVNGAASASAAPGDTFTYVVTATNTNATNTAPAYKVTVTDAVPAGVIVNPASLTASGGSLAGTAADGSGGTITWSVPGPVAKGASLVFTYSGTLVASSKLHNADTETNTASVTHYESLPTGGKNYTGPNTTATLIPKFPHITPTKSVAAGPAYLGQSKAWTITLTNDGGAAAQHVSATDTLPLNWSYDTGSANVMVAGAAGTAVEPTLGTDGTGHPTLTWPDLGTAPVTGVRTIVITFTATPKNPDAITVPGVGSGVAHTNTVSTTAKDATGVTGNATGAYNGGPATASTHIDAADLKIVKASDHKAVAGGTLTYTLTVSNTTENGASDQAVGGFMVVDTLPSGLGTVTASGTGWTCSVSGTTLTCSRNGTLSSGSTFPVITVTAAIPSDAAAGTSLGNSATVSGTTYDPHPGNNTDAVTDTVTRQVDVQIVKTVSSSPVVAGQNLTYTLDVKNNGISDSASGVFTVTDVLPSGLSFVSATGTGWSCGESGGTITCTTTKAPKVNGTLPTITVTATVAASVTGKISNTATVVGPEPGLDPNTGNNSSTADVTPSTSADLAVSKTHSTGADDWIAGGTGAYTFTVLNYGPSDAAAPKVVDTLPTSVTFVPGSTTGAHWSCSASGQTVTCNRDAALDGGTGSAPTTEQFTFQVLVSASVPSGANIHNSATVSSTTTDPNPGNNTGTDDTSSTQRADLGITKAGPATAVAGDGTISFTLGVHNHGESDTPAPVTGSIDPITVVDTLPEGMSYDSASGTNWSCSASGRTVTCTLSTGLASGADAPTLTVTAAVDSDVTAGKLTNYASVSGPLTDIKPANNTASKDVTISVSPSLTITKTASHATVRAGQQVTYTITVNSTGPSDATNLEMSDPLATGLTFVSADGPAGWTCSGTAVDCTIAVLAAGHSATFTVKASVGSGVLDGTTIANIAKVTADGGLSKTDDAQVSVVAEADLTLAKSHPDPSQPVLAGHSVTFTLTAHNNGPSDAQPDVKIVDTLPAGMTFTGSTGLWDCTPAGQVVTCVLQGNAGLLADADAPTLRISATVAADLDPTITKLTNSAEVSSGMTDPDHTNNTAVDDVLIGYRADLSITKTHDAATVRVGDPLTFTLQVVNAGPSVARNTVVTDTLPGSLTYVSSDGGADWACTFTSPTLECSANGDVAVGTPAAITVTTTVTAAAYPSVVNTATVDSDTPDPDTTNNTATDSVTVPPKVDLSITKSHTPEPLQVGQQAAYALSVSNVGATDDPGPVTVTDSLPSGLTFFSGTGDGWTCSAAGADVACTRAAGLATGHTSPITLLVTVGPAAYPQVTNTARVSSPAEDTDLGNNIASDPATVLPLYSLSLAKSVRSVSGSIVSWTLAVTNAGPNEAPAGASFTDSLPTALSFAGYTGDGWTCTAAAQVVTCEHPGAIASGVTVSVVLTTTVASSFSGKLVNAASLSGDLRVVTASVTIAAGGGGGLAYTGVNLGLGVAGLVLVLGGAAALATRRRRE